MHSSVSQKLSIVATQREVAPAAQAQPIAVLCWFEADQLRKVDLDKSGADIGRAKSAKVSVRSRHVSSLHAKLRFDGQQWQIKDQGSTNGINIDGRSVREHQLSHQSCFRLGDLTFWLFCRPGGGGLDGAETTVDGGWGRHTVILDPRARGEGKKKAQPAERLRLECLSGGRKGERFYVLKGAILGREQSDIDLQDESVSSRHSRLLPIMPGIFFVQDLKSTNGTYVNGALLVEPRPLQSGDTLKLGETRIRAELTADGPDNRSGRWVARATRVLAQQRLSQVNTEPFSGKRQATASIKAEGLNRKKIWIRAGTALSLVVLFLALFFRFESTHKFSAELSPAKSKAVLAPADATVKELHVTSGQQVVAGAPLLALDTQAVDAELQSAQQRLRQLPSRRAKKVSPEVRVAREELRRQGIVLHYALRRLRRAQAAYKQGLSSREVLEQASESAQSARSDYRLAKARLAQTIATSSVDEGGESADDIKKEIARLTKLRQSLLLKAPFDGVAYISHSVGDEVKNGDHLGLVVVDSDLYLVSRVPEAHFALTERGKRVTFHPKHTNQAIHTTVERASSRVLENESGRFIEIRARIPNKKRRFKMGQAGHVELSGARMSLVDRLLRWFKRPSRTGTARQG